MFSNFPTKKLRFKDNFYVFFYLILRKLKTVYLWKQKNMLKRLDRYLVSVTIHFLVLQLKRMLWGMFPAKVLITGCLFEYTAYICYSVKVPWKRVPANDGRGMQYLETTTVQVFQRWKHQLKAYWIHATEIVIPAQRKNPMAMLMSPGDGGMDGWLQMQLWNQHPPTNPHHPGESDSKIWHLHLCIFHVCLSTSWQLLVREFHTRIKDQRSWSQVKVNLVLVATTKVTLSANLGVP